ncbi:MAG: hypothetical protein ACQEQH_07820 [Bacillota bacterium]
MQKVLVSGKSKSSGKTTFITKMLGNLKGEVCVIKSTIHDKYTHFELIDEKEIIQKDNTDTSKFIKSGAKKVYFLKSNKDNLKKGIERNIKKITNFDYLIVEGNSIIDYINFNLIFYLDKEGGDKKDSAVKCENQSDIIIGRKDYNSIEFNTGELSCSQAHLLGNSLGIKLKKIGKIIKEEDIKVTDCQLGLF